MPPATPSFWSRPRTPLLLGAAACAACCALPLAAVVIGAGAATTAAAFFEPAAAVLVAIGIAMAGVAYRRRRAAAAAAPSCATTGACELDRSCGCGPLPVDRARAVGCTLPDAELPERGDELRRIFRRGLKHREVRGDRAIWTFAWSPDLERDAQALARAEQGCCSFWTFDLRREGDDLRWEAVAPPDRRDAILLLDEIARESMASSPRA